MKRKSVVIVFAVLILLAAAIAVLTYLNKPEDASGETLNISVGSRSITLSLDEIKSLDYIERELHISSTNHSDEEGRFRGVTLPVLLKSAGIEDVKKLSVKAADGYVAEYDASELDGVMLVYSVDGDELGTMEEGGTGPFRTLALEDGFGLRSVKNIVELTVEN